MHVIALVEATAEGQARVAEWIHRRKYPECDGKSTSPVVTEVRILDIKVRKECIPYLLADLGYFGTTSRKAIEFRNAINKSMGLLKRIFGFPIDQPVISKINRQAGQDFIRFTAKCPTLVKINTIGVMEDDDIGGEEGV